MGVVGVVAVGCVTAGGAATRPPDDGTTVNVGVVGVVVCTGGVVTWVGVVTGVVATGVVATGVECTGGGVECTGGVG